MKELVQAIRSGKVDLTPRENSGWYDHQVYALETMLLPEVGEEHNKLLLTKPYKKRMLEAFAALITKRRETHVRQLDMPTAAMAARRRASWKMCSRGCASSPARRITSAPPGRMRSCTTS